MGSQATRPIETREQFRTQPHATRCCMMSDDLSIEQALQEKGKTAARITPADIAANIVSEHFFTAYQGAAKALEEAVISGHEAGPNPVPDALRLLTVCILVLKNGFTVTGESACASPENFDAEIGRQVARQHAIEKIWPLMGYELRSKLYRAPGLSAK